MDLNKSGSQNETIFKRVEEISKLLCLSNRQVTDDALLNNLLTELNKYIIKCKKQSELKARSAEFLKILREAFNNCENLKANNLAFLIEFFGNSIDYFEAPVCIKSFLRLQESDIFEKEALIRSSWLSAYTGFIERFEEEISNEEAREVIQKLSNDISVFVSRQAQLTTIALLLRNKENQDEFEKIVNDCVFHSSDFLYSLLVNVKKMESLGTKPVELCKKIYSLMSKEQKSARIVELYLDMHSIATAPGLSEDECFEITDEFFIKEHFRIHTLVASMQDDPNTAMGGCLQRMLAILDDEEQPHVQFLDVLKNIDNYLESVQQQVSYSLTLFFELSQVT